MVPSEERLLIMGRQRCQCYVEFPEPNGGPTQWIDVHAILAIQRGSEGQCVFVMGDSGLLSATNIIVGLTPEAALDILDRLWTPGNCGLVAQGNSKGVKSIPMIGF